MIVMRRVKIEVNRPKIGDRIRVGRNKNELYLDAYQKEANEVTKF